MFWSPRIVSYMASYDVASDIRLALKPGEGPDQEVLLERGWACQIRVHS